MRLGIYILFFSIFFYSYGYSQVNELKVYLNEGQFYTAESGNYIEVQLNFVGYSLNYKTEDSLTYAEIEIHQTFFQNDSLILTDRYLLKSPLVIDSFVDNFFDIQRYPLAPGNYKYSLFIKDVNSKEEALTLTKPIEITDLSKDLAFSSFTAATLIVPNPKEQSIYTKMGYDVVPMMGNYYPSEVENLLYYFEIYNSNIAIEDSIYVVEQKVIKRDSEMDMDEYTRYFRYKSSKLQPVSKVIDIRSLPTGSYILELNLLNRDKTILARTSFDFDRNNLDEVNKISYESIILNPEFEKSIHSDSTGYYVASLIPIAMQAEVKNIIRLLKEKNKEKNYQYLQAFWINVNSKNPYEAWMKYKSQVQMVERLFGTNFQAGFDTDRGRVYLAYGSPSSIIEELSSPSEYPYEIWRYDKIKQYSNCRFIFYNPTNLNKDYKLLHSDMLGEIQNYRWQYALNKRNTPDANLDDPTGGTPAHFGGNSSLYYNSY